MNRIFGFFKEKLIEAKEENQADLQNILSAIEFEAYSEAKMLNYLQEIKTNYLEWNIMIANEASTGLYYTQIHNKTAILKKLKGKKESEEKQERFAIVLAQMRKTLKELQSMEKLNYQWTNNMNIRV
jgi:isocitrate/isopropylmalate dehydrogenase